MDINNKMPYLLENAFSCRMIFVSCKPLPSCATCPYRAHTRLFPSSLSPSPSGPTRFLFSCFRLDLTDVYFPSTTISFLHLFFAASPRSPPSRARWAGRRLSPLSPAPPPPCRSTADVVSSSTHHRCCELCPSPTSPPSTASMQHGAAAARRRRG